MEDSKFDLPKPDFKVENEYCNYNQEKTNLFRATSFSILNQTNISNNFHHKTFNEIPYSYQINISYSTRIFIDR